MDQKKSSLLINSASLTLKKWMKTKMFHLQLSLVKVLHQFFFHHIIHDPSSPAAPRSTPTHSPVLNWEAWMHCVPICSVSRWAQLPPDSTARGPEAGDGWAQQPRAGAASWDTAKSLECTLLIVIALTHSNCEITANYALSPNPLLYNISVSEVD